MKIDSHQHFWYYNKHEYNWISDEMKAIRRDFLPDELKDELSKIAFDGSIAVQARQTLDETNWLLKLADNHEFIKGVVGWADLSSSEAETQLSHFSSHPKAVGVRHVIHDEPDIKFMLNKQFMKGISLLEKYNLSYDLLLFPEHLPYAEKLVKQFPNITFILDHISKPAIKEKKYSPWKEYLKKLAMFPNVYCKLSGMVTEADWNKFHPEDFTPYLNIVIELFGNDRVMIGSDWPVCRVMAGYNDVMDIVINHIAGMDAGEQAKILGGNAIKAYNIEV